MVLLDNREDELIDYIGLYLLTFLYLVLYTDKKCKVSFEGSKKYGHLR